MNHLKTMVFLAAFLAISAMNANMSLASGWFLDYPWPESKSNYSLYGTDQDKVYFCGDKGYIYSFNGTNSTPEFSGVSTTVFDILMERDMGFAVTMSYKEDGAVLLDTSQGSWQPVRKASGAYYGLLKVADNDIYAVGMEGTDPEAGILNGRILHYDGTTWSVDYTSPNQSLYYGICQDQNGNLYVAGTEYDEVNGTGIQRGIILANRGDGWSRLYTSDVVASQFRSITCTPGGTVYAGGGQSTDSGIVSYCVAYDGSQFTPQEQVKGYGIDSIFADSEGRILAGFNNSKEMAGSIRSLESGSWVEKYESKTALINRIRNVGSTIYAAGSYGLMVKETDGVFQPISSYEFPYFTGIWGEDRNHVYAVGIVEPTKSVFYSYSDDHQDWSYEDETPAGIMLNCMWGKDKNKVYSAGTDTINKQGVVYRRYGEKWNQNATFDENLNLVNIWVWSDKRIYVCGQNLDDGKSVIKRLDDHTWYDQLSLDNTIINSVWGAQTDKMWACGARIEDGTYTGLLFYSDDGKTWEERLEIENTVFTGIWGSEDDNVFLIGQDTSTGQGVVYLYDDDDDKVWTKIYDTPAELGEMYMINIKGTDKHNVYALATTGYKNYVFNYDDENWHVLSYEVDNLLNALWIQKRTNVFACGSGGALARFDGVSNIGPYDEQIDGVQVALDAHIATNSTDKDVRKMYDLPNDFQLYAFIQDMTAKVRPAGGVATFKFTMTGIKRRIDNLRIYQVSPDGTSTRLMTQASQTDVINKTYSDGQWFMLDRYENWRAGEKTIQEKYCYYYCFAVQDNGPLDLDDTEGVIRSGFVMGKMKSGTPSGCNMSNGDSKDVLPALFLVSALALLVFRKRRKLDAKTNN